jgi:hypothetical protein
MASITYLLVGSKIGWLSGVEPELKAPQASVLPLHHNHHVLIFIAKT